MNPKFDEVGKEFVKHYYTTFDSNRSGLAPLYGEQSLLTFEGEQFQGSSNIVNKISSLPFQQVRHEVVMADCQPIPTGSGIIVFVTGNLFVDGSTNPLKFGQVFHLGQNASGGYYCANDVFRLNIG